MSRSLVQVGTYAFAVMVAASTPAHTDYIVNHAALQCGGAGAIIRFGESYSGDAPVMLYDLPSELAARWLPIVLAPENRCRLSNGDLVTVRYGRKQPRAYGQGGGDPPSFFSLWINNRKVISREDFDAPFGPLLNSVSYIPGTVSRCAYRMDGMHQWIPYEPPSNIPIACTDQPLDLNTFPVDPLEAAPREREAIGTISLAPTDDATFCRRFIGPAYEGWKIGSYGTKDREVLSFTSPSIDIPFPVGVSAGNAIHKWGSAEFDFDNDGTDDTVINIPGQPGRGNNMLLVKSGGATDDAIAMVEALPMYDFGVYRSWAWENSWKVYYGETTSYLDRLVQMLPITIEGVTYVLAEPHEATTKPNAILMRVRKNESGPISDDWEPICTFQLVEENF